jgi:hypothetical protein
MNMQDWRAFAEQTKSPTGAIVATETLVSTSLLEDAVAFAAYLPRAFENTARAFYDRDDCTYTYVPPDEGGYAPGPFAYRHHPGDLPEGAVLMIGRVRVCRHAGVGMV